MSFSQDIDSAVGRTLARLDALVRKVALDLDATLVELSPVGDPSKWKYPPPKGYVGGQFRANWQVGVNRPPAGVMPGIDRVGTATVARGQEALLRARAGDVIYIVNNLPYARRLEYDQWSKQAPNGIVGPAVLRFDGILQRATGASSGRGAP